MLRINTSKIYSGETIAVGLSGGEDSVCLFDVLFKEKDRLGIKLVAINVEHGIRGESSARDSEFCQALCDRYGVTLYRFSVDVPALVAEKGYTTEQAARILRYDCFFDCIKRGLCDKVAVAHHLSDQAETILFNLLRGSSLSGAKGISASAYNDRVIRPFLDVTKEDIKAYVAEYGLTYVTDESNADVKYTRNALRLKVFPAIKEVFPTCEAALVRFAYAAASDDEYLYKQAEKYVKSSNNHCKIATGIDYPLFSRAVIIAFKRLGFDHDYTTAHVDAVYSLCENQTGKKVSLPANLYAIRERDCVKIAKTCSKSADNRPIAQFLDFSGDRKVNSLALENGKTLVFEQVAREDVFFGDGLYFDGDKVPPSAVLRYREDGDTFTKFNGQTVTLKKYLTDKKVPADEKKNVLVLAEEKTVYLIVNLEISSLIKIDNDTINIVKLYCK